MGEIIQQTILVPNSLCGSRVDCIAKSCFSDFSRSRLQAWIKQGALQVNGKQCRPKDKLFGGEAITLNVEIKEDDRWEPECIPLNIVYEDEHIIIINKPSGLVVHPAAGNYSGTLLNGLLYRYPELSTLPRAGIVHRLDKNTTGLMVVARSLLAFTKLVEQLQKRSVSREYEAITQGLIRGGGIISEPIGRHPVNRLKMAVVARGKHSVTHYHTLKRFRDHSYVMIKLETGRTHQIRVHMAHIRYPLVGDALYAGRLRLPKGCLPQLTDKLLGFRRQALHARRLGFVHPAANGYRKWEAPLPEDFQDLLLSLQHDEKSSDEQYYKTK